MFRFVLFPFRVQIIDRRENLRAERYFKRGGTLTSRTAAGAAKADRSASEEDERQRRWRPEGRDSSGQSEDGSELEGDSEQHPRTRDLRHS